MGFYTLSYLCILVFILAAGYRVYRQLTLPVHVRWEIYPVQHETTDKLAHGGSYMEELNWWEKKHGSSLLNELKYMVPEILFIRGLWKENRSLWWVSFPFHFGLYLMIATFGLLVFHALLVLWGGNAVAGRRRHRNPVGRPHRFHGVDRSDPGGDRQRGNFLPADGRSGIEELFLFRGLFQYPVHPSFFPFRFHHLPVCRSAAGRCKGLCLRPADRGSVL